MNINTEFIQILEEEHDFIRGIFNEIDATDGLENKKILLQKLQSVLMPHLKKEDEKLYPALKESPDDDVRRMASIFSATMKGYSENFDMFLKEVLAMTDGEMSVDLTEKYHSIRDRIKDRITIEEVTIFPAYEKSI